MPTVAFHTLGCKVNHYETEAVWELFKNEGYEKVDFKEVADVYIINTCTVTNTGDKKSRQVIRRAIRRNPEAVMCVMGCYAQTKPKEIMDIDGVDIVIGTHGRDQIPALVQKYREERQPISQIQNVFKVDGFETLNVTQFSDRTRATLKIQDGCNNFCTYCIIPYIRGHYRSFPMEDLLEEARKLAEGGVKELILIAQETTVYGMDCYGRKALPELLTKLCEIEGIEWIRILYCYPEEITDELIAVMKKEKKICHYLDIPIQHSEDTILKRMGRRTNRAELVSLVEKLRKEIPDIVLRTTLITGFPGETEEEFKNMVDFVDSMEFDRLGVFPYSAEEGTKAAEMDGQITEEVKESRRDEIMALQQEISADKAASRIDDEMSVLIEGYLYEDDIYIGRTYMDAPRVDGNVFVRAEEELISGDIVPVRITGANEYDLMGDVIYADEFTE